MRKLLIVLSLLGSLIALGAGPAFAGTGISGPPKNCNELQELIGMQNVRNCDGS